MIALLDLAQADPSRVYMESWQRNGPGWQLIWTPLEGLDPDAAEVIQVQSLLGNVTEVFIHCGVCGPEAGNMRLTKGVAIACPKCYTPYILEVI